MGVADPSPPPGPAAHRRGVCPAGVVRPVRGIARFLYSSNPFYVISAVLVFYGLRVSFYPGGEPFETLALMSSLGAYTLMLAGVAVFLIRYARLWNDVRTILLVVVLMLLAVSVALEETLVAHPEVGTRYCLSALAVAIGLSEGLLRSIRLSLPALFRLPFYLILAVCFLYPVALLPVTDRPFHPALQWGLFGFPCVAGAAFLTLLPAVRRGPDYARPRGTPWPWPQYPWSLFVILAVALGFRAASLCLSMHPEKGDQVVFAPYFLVPLLLDLDVVLLELGLVARSRTTVRLAVLVPLALLYLAITPSPDNAADLGFLQRFVKTTGASPLFFTLLAGTVLYGVAMLRRVPQASTALTATLAALSACGPTSFNLETLGPPTGPPLLAIAAIQFALTVRRPSSLRCLVAAGFLIGGITVVFHGTPFTAWGGLIPLHLMLAAVLVIGATFRDPFARSLRALGAAALLAAGVTAVCVDSQVFGDLPQAIVDGYPLAAAAVAIAFGRLAGGRWYNAAAAGNVGCWAGVVGWRQYVGLRPAVAGLDYIAAGMLSFGLAILLSLTKTDLPRRLLARARQRRSAT